MPAPADPAPAWAAAALQSEQALFGGRARRAASGAPAGSAPTASRWLLGLHASALATRPTAAPAARLRPIESEADWQAYLAERVIVEAAWRLPPGRVGVLVDTMRQAAARHPVRWFFVDAGDAGAVGAVGLLHGSSGPLLWARLQDVDVFPRWRGRGFGHALLRAAALQAAQGAATALFVGADADDWPLGWYERSGFRRLLPVQRPRGAAFAGPRGPALAGPQR